MSRLFVAAIPPADVVGHLHELARPPTPGVRWAPSEQWHVTLCFLGDADEAAALGAFDGIEAAACDARLGPGVTLLGDSVLIVPVSGLDGLASVIMEAMAPVGHDYRFSGHLTLGRRRQDVRVALLGSAVEARWRCTEIVLVRSRLGADGAAHEPIAVRRLGTAQSS